MSRLTVVRAGLPVPPSTTGDECVSFDEFRRWAAGGRLLTHVARHGDGRILVHRLETAGRPLPLAAAMRPLCRGALYLEDAAGRRRAITWGQLARWSAAMASEPFRVGALLRRAEETVAALERETVPAPAPLDLTRSPLYLRTDLSFGVRAGGSVGHIAGVLNQLAAFAAAPVLLTTDEVATVDTSIDTHIVAPPEAFWNFRELPTLVLNDAFEAAAARVLGDGAIAFVYQRYSLNSYAGIRIARGRRVPLVIEYNGSEIWMARHWGRPLKYEALSERIERLNLAAADLIVVVSGAMEQELVARGVPRERILVNFNGVDPQRYSPDVDGRAVRDRYGLSGKMVIGFIGTFGPWHGAEVLASAYVALLRANPALAGTTRLLMIGDGARMADVKRIVADGGAGESAVFTGLVPQEEGPAHLAACDILISPHVPNPDGTPFFGSPTKLFEYMAMGKAIIASKLDQIAEVLEHGRNAWLVPPGDTAALARAVTAVAADEALRRRLGAAARRDVLEHHTWREHTRRTIERLRAATAAS